MKSFYRMLDNQGETVWNGKAYDEEQAEERCFFDESPGALERFTLQRWQDVKVTKSIKTKGWVTIYENQCLAPI